MGMTSGRPPHPAGDSPAARNVAEIAGLERESVREVSRGERISLAVTNAAGTPACALIHVVLLASWTLWNTSVPAGLRFDPYPFGLLTMIVSMEGVILAIFVLITQNRMSAHTDRRDHLSLQVNLLAEQEMTMVLRMLDRIAGRLGAAPDEPDRDEARQLMQHTNIYELMEELRRKFH
jgi:uncharacterized membrane protein